MSSKREPAPGPKLESRAGSPPGSSPHSGAELERGPRPSTATSDLFSWWLLAAAVISRGIWALFIHPPQDHAFSDMAHYLYRAQRLVEGGVGLSFERGAREFVWQPAGTHALLALPLWLFGAGAAGLRAAALMWASFSAATVVLTHALARAALPADGSPNGSPAGSPAWGPWPARLVGLAALVWIPHLDHAGYFVSETPHTCALLVLTWALVHFLKSGRPGWAAAAGLAAALAFSLRPQVAVFLVLAAALVLARPELRARLRPGPTLALVVPLALVAIVAIARVRAVTGQLAGVSENATMNLSAGRCHNVVTWAVPDEAARVAIEAAGPEGREAFAGVGTRVSLPGFRALARRGEDHPLALRPAVGERVVFVGEIGDRDAHRALRARCWAATGVAEQARYALTHVALLGVIARPWPESADHRSPWQLPLAQLGRRIAAPLGLLALPAMIAALVAWRRRERPRPGATAGPSAQDLARALCALQLLGLLVVAAVFFGSPRLRTPCDPYVLVLVAWMIPALARRARATFVA